MTERGTPPTLDGFTFVEQIGQGGFADVFLYQQEMPSRRVAVKVLLASAVDGPARAQFHAEANVMAQLSGHPSIVPIYQAGISKDGRPYLVMEYCPPPSLAGRFRAERFEVPESLETMIRISSAVETAHRAGILHRDIKPHNILVSGFGAPMLTDFGIAGATSETTDEAYGLSVPWSPPEAFGETMPADPRSDVYSLAATLYSLLAGRSPFEVPGASNDNATLMSRIERQPVPRVNRADMPAALQAVLERAMSKNIADRHPSAMAFARALQDVQVQLHLGQTRIDVLDASPAAAPVQDTEHRTQVRPVQIIVPDEDAGTRLRPIVVPQAPNTPPPNVPAPGASAPSAPSEATALRPRAARSEPVPDTMARTGAAAADHTDGSHFLPGPATDETPDAGPAPGQRSKVPLAVLVGGVAAALIAVIVVVALTTGGDERKTPSADPGRSSAPDVDDVLGDAVAPPTRLRHEGGADGVTFSWSPAEGATSDQYIVRTGPGPDELSSAAPTTDQSVTVKTAPGDIACIELRAVDGSATSEPVSACEVNQ